MAAFFTILIWGTTYVSTKVLLESFSPIEILFTRFIMGYIALLIIYPHKLKTKSLHEELLFMGAGLCGITLYFLLENIALTYTLASNAGIIISIAPLFTAVFAHFFLHGEKLRPQFFLGFIIAITGIILIEFNGSFILNLIPKRAFRY
ncbi:MAG: DMT family transporter [Peptococcaceae bacterium]|nr:DMT family transporter [Peptococcaceae bacterium]